MNKIKILVVEDERIVAHDLRATLQRAGYHVPGLAASGEEAIRLATALKPDLILMDIVLQGEMDGIAAAGQIRDKLGIPVIYLSSYGDPGVVERAKATEPIGYVLKPYENQDLLTTIEVVLHQYKSGQQRAEAALLAGEARFRTIFESAAWGIALLNRNGQLVEANPAFHQMLGCRPALLVHRPWAELLDEGDRAREAQLARELFAGQRDGYQLEQRLRRPDGRELWLRSHVSLFPNEQGLERQFALRMVEDCTEEKRLRDQLLRAQRMEIIGTLTSGLAHNLGNVMAPALMGIDLLRTSETAAPSAPVLDNMETSLKRGLEIIRQLLTFGRGFEGPQVPLDPGPIVSEIAGLIRGLFSRQISLDCHIAPGLWRIRGDANRLHQALLNLCTNARDAMPAGGRLTLAAANHRLDPAGAQVHPNAQPGPYVVLSVTDTGHGMPPVVQERLFEPFFTTKPADQGTGLGLATTLGIVQAHGGFIELDSLPGRGTEFRLYLPALPEPG